MAAWSIFSDTHTSSFTNSALHTPEYLKTLYTMPYACYDATPTIAPFKRLSLACAVSTSADLPCKEVVSEGSQNAEVEKRKKEVEKQYSVI